MDLGVAHVYCSLDIDPVEGVCFLTALVNLKAVSLHE